MKSFNNVVREIRGTLTGIILFFVLLNSLIIFLILYFILSLFELYPLTAAIPAIIYFFVVAYRESTVSKVKIVEKYYPQLREKLRTAADYADAENNPIVDQLHLEVIKEVKRVSAAAFFNRKDTTYKLTIIIVLCFAIVSATAFDLSLAGFKLKARDLIDTIGGEPGGTGNEFDPLGENLGGKGRSGDIYGARSIARLGNEELEVEMRPSSYEFMIRESEEESAAEEFTEQFPDEVIAQESENYRGRTPKQRDDQDIVKNYFKNLAEVEG